MKALTILATSMTLSLVACAGAATPASTVKEERPDYALTDDAKVKGAEVILRQIIDQQLLGNDELGQAQTRLLRAYFGMEQNSEYTHVEIVSFGCEIIGHGSGCVMKILDGTSDGTESLSELTFVVRQGALQYVEMSVIAG